jgi:hypothetical protein
VDPSCTSSFRTACRLQPTSRPPGCNDCGMVVWLLTLRTPECPQVGGDMQGLNIILEINPFINDLLVYEVFLMGG